MIRFRIALFLTFISIQSVKAQEGLIMQIFETGGMNQKLPFLGYDLFDKVSSGKIKKDTGFFGFKGRVKSVCETSYYVEGDTIFGVNKRSTMMFNKNEMLSLYLKGDTNKVDFNCVKYYYYDNKNN